jgi:hypothetical protein
MRHLLKILLASWLVAFSLGSQAANFSNFGQWSYTHFNERPGTREQGTVSRSSGVNGSQMWATDTTRRELTTLWPIDGGYLKPTSVDTTFTIGIGSQGCGNLSVSQTLPSLGGLQIVQQGVGIDWSVTPTIYAGAGCSSNGQVWVNAGGKVSLKGGVAVQVIVFKVAAGVYLTLGTNIELRAGPGGKWDVAPNPEFNGPINWVRFTVNPSVSGGLYGAATLGIKLNDNFVLGISLDGQLMLLSVSSPIYAELGWKYVNPARTKFKFYTDHALKVDLSGGSASLGLTIFSFNFPLLNTDPIWSESYYVIRNFSRPDDVLTIW